VTNTKEQHNNAIIVDAADEPIVTHPVSPEIPERWALHSFSNAPWIFQLC
jgi:hypothetical protein